MLQNSHLHVKFVECVRGFAHFVYFLISFVDLDGDRGFQFSDQCSLLLFQSQIIRLEHLSLLPINQPFKRSQDIFSQQILFIPFFQPEHFPPDRKSVV